MSGFFMPSLIVLYNRAPLPFAQMALQERVELPILYLENTTNMSNKASNNLHSLICSMSKAEKRYFKLYSSRHTLGDKNNYSILFDAVDKQAEYDEEKILNKFKREAFTNRFSISKRRLYEAVLKSLDAFHSNSSVDEKIRKQLHYAEILFDRSLYDQCDKILQSAQKLASKHQRWNALLQISDMEKGLNEKYNYAGPSKIDPNKIRTKDKAALKGLEEYSSLWSLKSELFNTLYQKGTVRNNVQKKELETLVVKKLYKFEPEELAPRAKYLYHHIHSAYWFAVGEYAKSCDHLEQNFTLIKDQHAPFREPESVYLSVLTNLIYMYHRTGNYDQAIAHLDELKNMPLALDLRYSEDLKVRMFTSVNSVQLTLFLLNRDLARGQKIIPDVEAGLLLYGDKIGAVRRSSFYYLIAAILFHSGEYSKSLAWVNHLLNEIDIDGSAETHCFAQLLYMLLHLELGNKDLLPYALRSTQRYLKTRERTYKFETLLLEFIATISRAKNKDTRRKCYLTLQSGLFKIENDPYESAAFEHFDLLNWVGKKLIDLERAEIMDRRA